MLTIIPTGIIGLRFGDWIEMNTRAVWIVGASLIFWGVVLALADRISTKFKDKKDLESMSWKNALFIGFAQVIALIPGTSRSGITMTAGLFSKLDKKSAAEFSFLMSIPIIALAGFLKILELYQTGSGSLGWVVYGTGFLSAMVSGFFAIWFLMKLIKRWNFLPFAVYRIIVGVIILVLI
jgi:undecaprenyl-diphosphatase